MSTRLLIIGGVAGGATAGARARRLDEHAHITILERGPYVSYANCGLPYFIARQIEERDRLLLATPESFATRYRIDVKVQTEAVELDRAAKRVRVRGPEGEAWLPYDRLILGQGGLPVRPPLPGSDASHVFTLWSVPDMDRLDTFIATRQPKSAVVVGGGFIGLEMAEAFHERGIATTVVEMLPTVMSLMDAEFGVQVARELERHRVQVVTDIGVRAVHADRHEVELTDGRTIPAELVLFATGVRPELALARQAGLTIGESGGLVVNENMQTSDPDIYAAGDMIEVEHLVSGKKARVPLAGPANRQGRIAASNAMGVPMPYGGALGTSVVKIFDATAGITGLSERAARAAGFDVGVAIVHANHHAKYYPGARELSLKLVYDRQTARLLGGQAFGHAGVDKRIDVLAMALLGKMTLHELARVDLSYAPPYSSANDPVNVAAFVGENDIAGYSPNITATQLADALQSATPPLVLDVRTATEYAAGHIRGAVNIPVDEVRDRLHELPNDRDIAIHCKSGFRGHLAARILRQRGFERLVNVTGGWTSFELECSERTRKQQLSEALRCVTGTA
jgi:NADPH-dependent 2,4-dienoyl-CoA reductase/sulfur reductase-like enzyme/rhodanese-related sulfurtransferase